MLSLTCKDKVNSTHIFPDVARNLLEKAKPTDKYVIYDSKRKQHWYNQSWCDHNIFGFHLGDSCTAYPIEQLKSALEFYDEMMAELD